MRSARTWGPGERLNESGVTPRSRSSITTVAPEGRDSIETKPSEATGAGAGRAPQMYAASPRATAAHNASARRPRVTRLGGSVTNASGAAYDRDAARPPHSPASPGRLEGSSTGGMRLPSMPSRNPFSSARSLARNPSAAASDTGTSGRSVTTSCGCGGSFRDDQRERRVHRMTAHRGRRPSPSAPAAAGERDRQVQGPR